MKELQIKSGARIETKPIRERVLVSIEDMGKGVISFRCSKSGRIHLTQDHSCRGTYVPQLCQCYKYLVVLSRSRAIDILHLDLCVTSLVGEVFFTNPQMVAEVSLDWLHLGFFSMCNGIQDRLNK